MTIGSLGIATVVEVSAHKNTPDIDLPSIDYMKTYYANAEEKLATMTLMIESNGTQLWVQEYTGEVALRDATTGEVVFTNPYDIASTSFKNVNGRAFSKI